MWHKKGKERNSLTRDRCRCELSLMEVSEVNEVKVESCSRVKDGNGRLAL